MNYPLFMNEKGRMDLESSESPAMTSLTLQDGTQPDVKNV